MNFARIKEAEDALVEAYADYMDNSGGDDSFRIKFNRARADYRQALREESYEASKKQIT